MARVRKTWNSDRLLGPQSKALSNWDAETGRNLLDGFYAERFLKFNDNDRLKKLGGKVDLPEDRCFVGLNAYQDVINAGVDLVILATPPLV